MKALREIKCLSWDKEKYEIRYGVDKGDDVGRMEVGRRIYSEG